MEEQAVVKLFGNHKPIISNTQAVPPETYGNVLLNTLGKLSEQLPLILVVAPPTPVLGGDARVPAGNPGKVFPTPLLGLYLVISAGNQSIANTIEIDVSTGGIYNIGGGDIKVYVYNESQRYYNGGAGYTAQVAACLAVGVSSSVPSKTFGGFYFDSFSKLDVFITATHPLHALVSTVGQLLTPQTDRVIPQVVTSAAAPIQYALNMNDFDGNLVAQYILSTGTYQPPIEMSDDVARVSVVNLDPVEDVTSVRYKFLVKT